jgi:tetratricopeptide (TPR) repeat protein
MHDLVRLYAAQQARHKLPQAVRHAALQRLAGFLLHTSYAAERLLAPHRPPVDIGAPAAGCSPVPLADQDAALRWFTAEHPCLLAVQRLALESGWAAFVWQLAWSTDTYHYRRGDLLQQLACWRSGLAAARRADDPVAESLAHRVLGHACARTGRQDDALDHLQQALALAERSGDPSAEAHTHQALAVAWGQRGDDRRALHHARNALRGYQTLKDPVREADSLNDMGWYAARLGRYGEAQEHCEAALALFRHHRHRDGEANTLDSLGYLAQHTGRHRKALEHYRQALTLLQEIGNTYDEADTWDHLGDVHASLDDPRRASAAWRQALRLYEAQDRQGDADRIRRRLDAQAGEPPGAPVAPGHAS